MKYSASFFLIVIGIVCLLLFKKWGSPNKEGFVTSCAAGKYLSSGTCYNCTAGKFSLGGGATSCTNCLAGTYSSAAGASTCTACTGGKTSPEGSTSSAACVCAAGTYLSGSTCTACANGTYSAAGGACTVDAYIAFQAAVTATNAKNGTIATGNVYFINPFLYSYVALDKLGNIYTSMYNNIRMIAGSRINPYPLFLTDASGNLIPNTTDSSGNPNTLTLGTTYYLNIGEKMNRDGNTTPGSTRFANNTSASNLKVDVINTIVFDNLNNIYITDDTNQHLLTCSVIYKIDSSGNINIIAGKSNSTYSTTPKSTSSQPLLFTFGYTIEIKLDIYNNIYVLDRTQFTLFFIPSGTANPFPNIISGNLIAGNIYTLLKPGTGTATTNPNPISTNGDGGLATNAVLSSASTLRGFTVDSSLNIYIHDNYLIRMICGPNTTSSPFKCYNMSRTVITSLTPGYIYRIAGTGEHAGTIIGSSDSDVDAIDVQFGNIRQVEIDYQGNLHIFDNTNIRMISATNNVPVVSVYPFSRVNNAAPGLTAITNYKKSYIYKIVGSINPAASGVPSTTSSPKIENASFSPIGGCIDIFGNYYMYSTENGGVPMQSGLYKAVINILACPSPLPSGVASCKASDINTPGSLICTNGYANPSGTACITCEAGFYCTKTETGNLKIPCAQGTYNSLTGQESSTACLLCSAGAYSLGGAASCSTCAAGTSSDGTSICSACAAGKYSIAGQSCSNCPQGTYNSLTGQASCSNCPASTYNINTGSTSSAACLSCPVGSYCPIGSANGALCPQGTYNSNTGQAICSNCPAGSYNNNTGSISSNACIACQTGFYALAGASQCTPCANNAYSCTPTSLICNSNYYDNGSGACTACPTDSTCAIGGGCNATSLTAFECSGGYSRIGLNCSKTQYSSNLPNHTRGTNQQMNDSMPYFYGTEPTDYNTAGCDTTNTCQYNWSGSIGPASSNPCPAKNSWYDWGQQKCVDDLGKPVDVMNPCGSNTVYDLKTNACLTVQKAFASQPPNTIGLPSLTSPGDFSNCRTVDQGDCTPYYVNGTTTTTINPCIGLSKYNFLSRSCTMTEAAIQTSNCCGLEANTLATTPGCSNLVNSSPSYTIIAEKCPPGTNDICCGATMKTNATCINRGPYWTTSPGYATNNSYNKLCSAGFQDYDNAIDTMATKRLEWLQRRQRINA